MSIYDYDTLFLKNKLRHVPGPFDNFIRYKTFNEQRSTGNYHITGQAALELNAFRKNVSENCVLELQRLSLYNVPVKSMPLRKVKLRNLPHALSESIFLKLERPLGPILNRFEIANNLLTKNEILHGGVKTVWIAGTIVQAYGFYNALRQDGRLSGKTFDFGKNSKTELTAWGAGSVGGVIGAFAGGALGAVFAKKPGFKIGSTIGAAALGAFMNYAGRDLAK